MTSDQQGSQENYERGGDPMTAPAPALPQAEATDTDSVPFSTRVRAQTKRDIKVHASRHGLTVQDVTETALREYLDRNS